MTVAEPCPRCKRGTPDGLLCGTCLDAYCRALADLAVLLPELAVTMQRQDNLALGVVHPPEPVLTDEELLAEERRAARDKARFADEQARVPARLRSRADPFALIPTALPVNLDAADLYRTVTGQLRAAAAALRAVVEPAVPEGPLCGNPGCVHQSCALVWDGWRARHQHHAETRLGALPWLTRHPEAVRGWDGAPALVTALVRAVPRIERAVDLRDPDVYLGPCDSPDVTARLDETGTVIVDVAAICGTHLYARPGDPTVDCPVCGLVYQVSERREWLRDAMRDVYARPAQIAASLTSMDLPLNANTLDKWISRDKRRWRPDRPWGFPYPPILQVGIDSDDVDEAGRPLGKPLFRFGDVLARVEWIRAQRAADDDEVEALG